MQLNENRNDRIIRIVLGIILLVVSAYVILTQTDTVILAAATIVGLIGVIALVTGAVGVCLIYKIFGWSTA